MLHKQRTVSGRWQVLSERLLSDWKKKSGGEKKSMGFWIMQTQIRISPLPLTAYLIQGKLCNFSQIQYPHL